MARRIGGSLDIKAVREGNLRLSLLTLYPQRFVLSSQNGKTHSVRNIYLLLFYYFLLRLLLIGNISEYPSPIYFLFCLIFPSMFKLLLICWYPSALFS